jgi:hypothetical protein
MCNYPSQNDALRAMELRTMIRCFDRNEGRSFALPTTDPHGEPITLLSREELKQRLGWCMLPEYHDAIHAEIGRRLNLPHYYQSENARN